MMLVQSSTSMEAAIFGAPTKEVPGVAAPEAPTVILLVQPYSPESTSVLSYSCTIGAVEFTNKRFQGVKKIVSWGDLA